MFLARLGNMERKEIGHRVAQRRRDLRLDVADIVRVAGIDRKTHTSLERGARWPRDSTRAKIEAALQWETGALDRLANDYEPIPVDNVAGVSGTGEELFFLRDVDVEEPAVVAEDVAGMTDVSADVELMELLQHVARGEVDAETRDRADGLLKQMYVGRLAEWVEQLSPQRRARVVDFVLELLEEQMIEGVQKNAMEAPQEPDAPGEATEDQKINPDDLIDPNEGSHHDPAQERQSDYGLANRTVPGKSRGELLREQQDLDAEHE